MRTLHLLASGGTGGIETLCKDYAEFSKYENFFVMFWNSGVIAEEMRKQGIDVIELNASKINIVGMAKKVFTICKEKKIDTVIVHHAAPIAHLYLYIIKIKMPYITTIAYAHGNAVDMCRHRERTGLFFRKKLLELSLKKADKVIAISDSVKNSLIDYFSIQCDKICVIYNGVNISKFLVSDREDNISSLEFIYVGRLIEEKGVQVILKSLAKLDVSVDYHFKIVGEGKYRSQLEKLAKDLNIWEKVKFLGNRRDIPELLKKSNIFIHMPCWEEGFGITIVEAMAAGLLCICANVGAIPEIINDGYNGFLVERENFEHLCNTIMNIRSLSNTEKIKISNAAIEKAESYSILRFASQMDSLLEKLKETVSSARENNAN